MTRKEILEAAAQIFSKKGFHAASMQDIAEAVHLQKGSLYHHVSSKQEILLEILDQALDLLNDQMEAVAALPLPPDEKLRQAVTAYLTVMLEHRDLAGVLLLEHRSLDPVYQSRHIPHRDRFENLWRSLIQEGINSGVFCCNDPVLTVRAILGTLNWTINWFRPDGPLTSQEIAGQFSGLFLGGLLARPAVPDA